MRHIMELYRNGLKLIATKGLDESRGSANVPVKLSHNEKDEYLNYTEQIHIRYLLNNQAKEEILPSNETGFYIPGKPLSHNGPIELAVHLIHGNVELVTNELPFVVKNAPNGTTQVDPSEFAWQQLVDQYVDAKLDTYVTKKELSDNTSSLNEFKSETTENMERLKTRIAQTGLNFATDLNQQKKDLTELISTTIDNTIDAMHPVGSVYVTIINTNPSTFLKGTWEQFAQGRTLVGVGEGTDGTTTQTFLENTDGGEYNHKLTIDEMPSHSHNFKTASNQNNVVTGWMDYERVMRTGTSYDIDKPVTNTGGDELHNNMQPYVTVYFWKRID